MAFLRCLSGPIALTVGAVGLAASMGVALAWIGTDGQIVGESARVIADVVDYMGEKVEALL